MCGICGEIRFDGTMASVPAVAKMAEAMAPRGPDGAGIVARDAIAFGHRRLTIIDLSVKSSQPMVDPTLGLTIVFNGCIYNYPELRGELEQLGYCFFSTGDTEVILKSYHAWGADCVKRFHGMFAFVIHERDTGRVVMARVTGSGSSRSTIPRGAGSSASLRRCKRSSPRATSTPPSTPWRCTIT